MLRGGARRQARGRGGAGSAPVRRTAALAVALAVLAVARPGDGRADGRIAAGAYLAAAAGCAGCHTAKDGAPYAGGRALPTPFGTFYSPNITADPETGIGRWSDGDFLNALWHGRDPDGNYLFPVFPYPSYTRISEADALAIKAYLASLPPVAQANKPHDLSLPFSLRPLQAGWRGLFFRDRRFRPRDGATAEIMRGAYLVTALGHCGECHTPRNALGGTMVGLALAGTTDGPEGEKVPNITPDKETGIGSWTEDELVELLASGTKPDFDNIQGSMAEVVERGTSQLSDADRHAIARYLLSLQPIHHRVGDTDS